MSVGPLMCTLCPITIHRYWTFALLASVYVLSGVIMVWKVPPHVGAKPVPK